MRIQSLSQVDPRLGPIYSVTMVKPTVWQFRAWVRGGPEREEREKHSETWHEIAGLVCSVDVGERVP